MIELMINAINSKGRTGRMEERAVSTRASVVCDHGDKSSSRSNTAIWMHRDRCIEDGYVCEGVRSRRKNRK